MTVSNQHKNVDPAYRIWMACRKHSIILATRQCSERLI